MPDTTLAVSIPEALNVMAAAPSASVGLLVDEVRRQYEYATCGAMVDCTALLARLLYGTCRFIHIWYVHGELPAAVG